MTKGKSGEELLREEPISNCQDWKGPCWAVPIVSRARTLLRGVLCTVSGRNGGDESSSDGACWPLWALWATMRATMAKKGSGAGGEGRGEATNR